MDFVLLSLIAVAFCVVVLVVIGRAYPGSGADLVDWFPTRSPEVEVQNEIDDVRQMIEAQNAYRAKRGAKPITEADVQRQAAEDQRVRLRGRGPFSPEAND